MSTNRLAVKDSSITKDLASYVTLRRRVRETLLRGQMKITEIRLNTYWETGRLIDAHVLHHKERAHYEKEVILKLSRDLDVGDELLYRARRFYEAYPISSNWRKLSWSHYRALSNISDEKKRLALEVRADQESWSIEKLQAKIKAEKQKAAGGDGAQAPLHLLEPKKGRIGVFRIVEKRGTLHLDRGFTSYRKLSEAVRKRFKKGDLVRFDGRNQLVKDPTASLSDLYTYESHVDRVVDADTIWMDIWLQKPDWVNEKLRLRGIDAPELGTPEGEAAKRFVESLVKKATRVTIATTKPDKWDRYLSDVFLTMPNGREVFLNNALLEKGFARRKEKFSLQDWEQ